MGVAVEALGVASDFPKHESVNEKRGRTSYRLGRSRPRWVFLNWDWETGGQAEANAGG